MLFFRGKEEKGLFDVNLDASPILEIGFYRGLSLLYAQVGRHIVCEPDVAANDGVMPNAYPSQDRGVGIDGDMVFQNGVAWGVVFGLHYL